MTPAYTPSQTPGPYFGLGLVVDAPPTPPHDAVRVTGVVRDGEGRAVTDALVEFWQLDGGEAVLRRAPTDRDGRYETWVHAPGTVRSHPVTVIVLAGGLQRHLVTRLVLADPDADVLGGVPAERRPTLVGRTTGDGIRFDIALQGEGETVFLDV